MWALRGVDAYRMTKVDDEFTRRSAIGGILTLLGYTAGLMLFYQELQLYLSPQHHSELIVDAADDGSLVPVTVNITFPRLPCAVASLDVENQMGEVSNNIATRKYRLDHDGVVIALEDSSFLATEEAAREVPDWEIERADRQAERERQVAAVQAEQVRAQTRHDAEISKQLAAAAKQRSVEAMVNDEAAPGRRRLAEHMDGGENLVEVKAEPAAAPVAAVAAGMVQATLSEGDGDVDDDDGNIGLRAGTPDGGLHAPADGAGAAAPSIKPMVDTKEDAATREAQIGKKVPAEATPAVTKTLGAVVETEAEQKADLGEIVLTPEDLQLPTVHEAHADEYTPELAAPPKPTETMVKEEKETPSLAKAAEPNGAQITSGGQPDGVVRAAAPPPPPPEEEGPLKPNADNIPAGSYSGSCGGCVLDAGTLRCSECRSADGHHKASEISIDQCGDGMQIGNNDGKLTCESTTPPSPPSRPMMTINGMPVGGPSVTAADKGYDAGGEEEARHEGCRIEANFEVGSTFLSLKTSICKNERVLLWLR
jgi:hypothetical protein